MLLHSHLSLAEQEAAVTDPILTAALQGDENAVRKALASDSDVNAVSKDGRNVLTALLTGVNWQATDASHAPTMSSSRLNILRLLISHRDMSLYTLNSSLFSIYRVNAPSPLGVAVLLNMPAVVQDLLGLCIGMVSVDFPDTHGGTPLMYACHHGNLEIAKLLLAHGARPDFRDAQYRTSIIHALRFPRVLWHCEEVLRRHRAQEILMYHNKRNICLSAQCHAYHPADSPIISPQHFSYRDPEFSRTLLECISSSQSQTINTLLFPTSATSVNNILSPTIDYLINYRDSRGWSPIHHCAWASRPSIETIDLLYLAGADISLPTSPELYTPLHCLALSSCRPRDAIDAAILYSFAVHLIRDLRAPLGSRDKNGDTCIHIAAEHGSNIDVLLAFLDCDAKSAVREMRNSRGLTAADVAKKEFRAAFGLENPRPDSAASMRTIKPKKSQKSLRSVASNSSITSVTASCDYIPSLYHSPPPHAAILPLFEQVFDDLRTISKALASAVSPSDLNTLEDLLVNTLDKGTMLLTRAKRPVDLTADHLRKIQSSVIGVSELLTTVSKDVENKLEIRTEDSQWNRRSRRRTTDSGSSEGTLVSQRSRKTSTSGSTKCGSDPDLNALLEDESKSWLITGGKEKFKNWFKKKLKTDSRPKETKPKLDGWEGPKGLVLRSSDRILDVASRDLASIEECVTMADQYIATSYHFISKAEAIFSQAIRNRQVAIYNARARMLDTNYLDPTLFTLPLSPPSSSEFSDPSMYDDELLRSFKRLLLRKLEAKVSVANEEIEKADVWLKLVKDIVKGLKEWTCVTSC